MERDREIKKAIYDLYSTLKDVASTKSGRCFLAPELIEKLGYTKEEVKKVLEAQETSSTQPSKPKSQDTGKVSQRISEIKDRDGVRQIYEKEMSKLFDSKVEKSTKTKIEKGLTVSDLTYLYSLLAAVGVRGRKTKKDLFQMFKDYYDDEARTADMNRKLMGK